MVAYLTGGIMEIIEIVGKTFTGRLRARKVTGHWRDEARAEKLLQAATEAAEPKAAIAVGGTVGGTYGYPAKTEVAIEVALPAEGVVVRFLGEVRAGEYDLTAARAAEAAAGESARDAFSGVASQEAAAASLADLIRRAQRIADREG